MSLDLPGEDVVGGLALASSHAPTQPFGHSPSAGCREKQEGQCVGGGEDKEMVLPTIIIDQQTQLGENQFIDKKNKYLITNLGSGKQKDRH